MRVKKSTLLIYFSIISMQWNKAGKIDWKLCEAAASEPVIVESQLRKIEELSYVQG